MFIPSTATWEDKPKTEDEEKQNLDNTYRNLLDMSFDEQEEFLYTAEAKEYFEALERMNEALLPEENLRYSSVLYGNAKPYIVTDEGKVILITRRDPSDPESSYWDTHEMPENFDPRDPNLLDAPLKEEFRELHSGWKPEEESPKKEEEVGFDVEYTDPNTGKTVYLPDERFIKIADSVYGKYKDTKGTGIDPYMNLISVLTNSELKTDGERVAEYVKSFEGTFDYLTNGTSLITGSDCAGLLHTAFEDYYKIGFENLFYSVENLCTGIAEHYKDDEDRFTKGPCFDGAKGSTPFAGTEQKAGEMLDKFCGKLEIGDMIVFI